MRYHDMKQAVKLLDKEWNLGKREAGVTSDVCDIFNGTFERNRAICLLS